LSYQNERSILQNDDQNIRRHKSNLLAIFLKFLIVALTAEFGIAQALHVRSAGQLFPGVGRSAA
jgi:hypothetical protein